MEVGSRYVHIVGITANLSCPKIGGSPGDLRVFRSLGGRRIFVDQAVEDGFSADLPCSDVGYGRGASGAFVGGDALGDALVRPGVL